MKSSLAFWRCLACAALITWLLPAQSVAADPSQFKPGDKIMYKDSGYPEVWEQGVFVRSTPDGKQPIIRKKPSQFFPDGFETGFQWVDIRPLAAPAADAKPAKTKTKRVAKASPAAPPALTGPPAPAPLAGALLTQAEILDFLRTRLGPEPFVHPQHSQIKAELAQMIKARGLAFRYETLSDFSNQLSKFGATSDITFPLGDNFGPPTQRSWLLGNWNLGKIGAAVDYTKDNRVFRQTEIGVKDVGGLTIQPDGKYIWKTDTAAGVLQGTWRPATSEEMKYQGGDGLVLLKAKSGWDWIVMQDRVTRLGGDWINIAELGTRQVRENGSRKAKAR